MLEEVVWGGSPSPGRGSGRLTPGNFLEYMSKSAHFFLKFAILYIMLESLRKKKIHYSENYSDYQRIVVLQIEEASVNILK